MLFSDLIIFSVHASFCDYIIGGTLRVPPRVGSESSSGSGTRVAIGGVLPNEPLLAYTGGLLCESALAILNSCSRLAIDISSGSGCPMLFSVLIIFSAHASFCEAIIGGTLRVPPRVGSESPSGSEFRVAIGGVV